MRWQVLFFIPSIVKFKMQVQRFWRNFVNTRAIIKYFWKCLAAIDLILKKTILWRTRLNLSVYIDKWAWTLSLRYPQQWTPKCSHYTKNYYWKSVHWGVAIYWKINIIIPNRKFAPKGHITKSFKVTQLFIHFSIEDAVLNRQCKIGEMGPFFHIEWFQKKFKEED